MLAPFPYFGGKSRIASVIWDALGDVPNYVEPFAGSAAVLLARPDNHTWWERTETINDADGMVSNYWRATQDAPSEVARWADWPVNENDLHARHAWLVARRDALQTNLEGDPTYYDAQMAGWWLWGICLWIGGGWCSGEGPWQQIDGKLARGNGGMGINRTRPHLSNGGMGINRRRPHLSDAGMGINRSLPHLGNAGMGICDSWSEHLVAVMTHLADRLRRVRVCCGDWTRVCGPSPTEKVGLTGVFLDPPYDQAERDPEIYAVEGAVSAQVREWAVAHGDNRAYRIALCGYAGEHEMPDSWQTYVWKASGGYGNAGEGAGRENSQRERIWFSPHCLVASQQLTLLAGTPQEPAWAAILSEQGPGAVVDSGEQREGA